MLRSVQYLRAFAALAVALFHFRPIFINAGGPPWIAALVDWGHGGVPIFFVLAGFIMVWTTRLQADPGRFLWNRLVRIYGGFLPIAVAFLSFKAATTGVAHWVPGGLDLFGSLTLTQANRPELLIFPAWTLPYELLFYLAFGLCLWPPRAWFFPACGLCVAVFAVLGLGGSVPAGAAEVFANPINICFLMGIGAGYSAMKEFHNIDAVFAVAAITAIGCNLAGFVRAEDHSEWFEVLSFGVGTCALLICLMRLESMGKIPHWHWLRKLGDASFAIYLLHMPLAFVWQTQQVVPYIAYYYGPYVLLIAYVCALILASLLYFWLVERPLNRRGRMLFDRLAQIVYAYRSAQNSPNR